MSHEPRALRTSMIVLLPVLLIPVGIVVFLLWMFTSGGALLEEDTNAGPSFDACIESLQSIEKPKREAAIERLVELGDVWRLVDALGHDHRNVREGAATALGGIGPDAADAVPALMKAFEDPDDYVRWKAAYALGEIGPAAKAALPMLDAAADAEQIDVIVQATAKKAVSQIRGE